MEARRLLAVDFGDAPEPYPTTLADDGARHEAIGPRLGALRDGEADGQPSTAADGDGTDEDGVTFGSIRVGQLDASVIVNVQNAPAGAKLDAWIDFNGDGSWGGPGEQIFDSVPVGNGAHALEFDVPSWAADGDAMARFRLSTEGDLGTGGAAAAGEVEDYQITIDPPAPAPGMFGGPNTISTSARAPNSVFAADMDGDGDLDVLSASWHRLDSEIAWYENDGSEGFTAHTISTVVDKAHSVFAADVDGDGDIDVLSAGGSEIAWYENDGSEGFTAHTISTTADKAWSVFAADVDGDGDLDVLSASISDGKIAWYENDGSEGFTAHIISTSASVTYSVFAADVDGDGDLDVLSASGRDDTIAWHENDGSAVFTAHTIDDAAYGTTSVFAADVDGDGDIDVLSASFDTAKIAWYENDGSEFFSVHTISTSATNATSVFAADVDGDGDLDVLSASSGNSEIAWYENIGLPPMPADFGDAPSPYPTRLSDDGPSHVASGPMLGATRDDEADGQPNGAADGDGADEDGVAFGAIMVGQLDASVTVNVHNAPAGAKLDAWIDFDQDGTWDGRADQIADSAIVVEGDNTIRFEVPAGVQRGVTYARFRLSSDGELTPFRGARDGEVEDYQILILPFEPADFGDAPQPYPTLFRDRGPSHVATGPMLGSTRDEDLDGQPTSAADGDGADDDGVVFGSVRVGQLDASVTVNVQNAPSGAKLDAWIDFDGDGNWGGPRERIANSLTVFNGDNILEFDVPGDAKSGASYARFRLSTAGAVGLRGAAPDGEVEDYLVQIDPPTIASDFASLHIISVSTDRRRLANSGDRSVHAADIDGDGDMDVISAPSFDDTLMWYENDGNANFTPHFISENVRGARSVSAVDIDGDNDIDVLAVSRISDTITWYENDGEGNFTPHVIARQVTSVASAYAADIDGDGNMDVLAALNDRDHSTIWYRHDGHGNFTAQVIVRSNSDVISLHVADVDGDGDADILTASRNAVTWHEQVDNTTFVSHTITNSADSGASVHAADLDGDGDLDVLSASRRDGKIAWYENDGDENFTAHVLTNSAEDALSVYAADVDGDGDMDILSASRGDNTVAWYENLGDATFVGHVLTTSADGASSVFAADLDGDGDLDVLFTAGNTDTLAWYENEANDFGDAPEPYPTLRSQQGARHEARGPMLGVGRDRENDGQPSSDADGDGADEDGVSFGEIVSGQLSDTVTVNVQNAPEGALLDAWIDFNGDGEWEAAEQIARSVLVVEGDNTIAFSVPGTATSDLTYARFRLSTAGGLTPFGAAADGEVEDYALTILPFEPADLGDAPAPYPTTLADDGARHEATGPRLGGLRDEEVDGQPSAGAEGDGLDEDGVRFGPIAVGQLGASMNVNVQNAPDGARLDAWIDFDGDGNWGGAWERIAGSVLVVEGDNTIRFDVPAEAKSGETFARFRLSTAGGLGPAQAAADGEVEDYRIDIEPPASLVGVFARRDVSFSADGARSVHAADLDGDGDVDILSASSRNGTIVWQENIGETTFVAHEIASSIFGVDFVRAADIDADGDFDVLVSLGNDDRIIWYENDGDANFTIRKIVIAGAEPSTVHGLADVDGDGDLDLLADTRVDSRVVWYENRGNGDFVVREVTRNVSWTQSLQAADMDRDGDVDILSTSSLLGTIVWHENDGNENFTTHVITTTAKNSQFVRFADIDGDGDMDVLSASNDENTIAWHENDGNQNFTSHVISATAERARWVHAADMDGDGDMDVLSASYSDDTIAWYENDGDGNFSSRVITTTADGAIAVYVADVDGDGDLDVLSASRLDNTIAWYENLNAAEFGDAPAPYPTLADDDGAYHDTIGPTLGAGRDGEADGQPTADADGDGDDDDGVILVPLRVGQGDAQLTVNVQNAFEGAILDAWIDFNGDGVWGGPLEQIARSVPVIEGDNTITFRVSVATDPDAAHFARFRLSTAGGLSPTGGASDGEVEDYAVSFLPFEAADFGDAPLPYPTLLSAGGAVHTAVGPMLGASRDVEGDGTPSSGADGDLADEDGVTFGPITVGQIGASVIVNVQNAPDGAKLDAWIDFNGDGNWGGPLERIATGLTVIEGDNTLTFDVPVETNSGKTFARFRLSTAGNLGHGQAAIDGEVEDYAVDIAAPGPASGFFDIEVAFAINSSLRNVHQTNIDNDDDLDLLVSRRAGRDEYILSWYEFDGDEFRIRDVAAFNNRVNAIATADLDGDGDLDIVLASRQPNALAWYENDGAGSFTTHEMATDANSVDAVIVADIDGDGDIDVLSLVDTVVWHENDGLGNFTVHELFERSGIADAVDMDGDGDLDLVGTDFPTIIWYENDGLENFSPREIADAADPESLFTVDLDNDGDMDVVTVSSQNSVVWYENDGSENFVAHEFADSTNLAGAVAAADIDGDGDLDLIWTGNSDHPVGWYRNDGNATFTSLDLTTSPDFGSSLIVADIDHDGDLDVLTPNAREDARHFTVYRQVNADFGDAPPPYPTLLSDDGPFHAAIGPRLGARRDEEVDGQPIEGDGGDDDGVSFSEIAAGQLTASVTVNVQNAPQGAKLDAWIDFDRDGRWSNGAERIAANLFVVEGDNLVTFNVPDSAIAGDTFARFRLSTDGNLTVSGAASDGEVEDYSLTIAPSVPGAEVFSANEIPAGTEGNYPFGGPYGMDFVVNLPIHVTALGAFDSLGDGFNRTISVSLWRRDDRGTPTDPSDDVGIAILASESFVGHAPGALIGGSRFKALPTPILLPPGSYTIVGSGYGNGEPAGNANNDGEIRLEFTATNSGNGALSFVGKARFGRNQPGFPNNVAQGPASRYGAGTFRFFTQVFSDDYPLPLNAVSPAGSLVYETSAQRRIDVAGAVDTFAVDLDAGQTISVVVESSGELQARAELRDSNNTLLAAASASAPGQPLVLSNVPVAAGGTYTLSVSGQNGTTGRFISRVTLNATIEAESYGGPANNSPSAAQDLEPAMWPLGLGSIKRAAVIGANRGDNDFYRFVLADGEVATIVLNSGLLNSGSSSINLYNADGIPLALGPVDVDGVQRIGPLRNSAGDGQPLEYFVRVAGAAAEYNLVVTRGAHFAAHDAGLVQDLTLDGAALGYLFESSGVASANFSVNVMTGDALVIGTSTPGDEPGQFVNLLDPRVELFDPSGALVAEKDNGAVDGRNVLLNHTAAMDGTYLVRVLPESNTAGEFVLSVAGHSGPLPAFAVTSIDPANGVPSSASPVVVTLDLNRSVLITSLDAADLTIDGTPANRVTRVDHDTVQFHFDDTFSPGQYTVNVAAGAIVDLLGSPVEPFASSLDIASALSGTLTSDRTLEGEWRISGDLLVPSGVTLTIGSGALLRFDAGVEVTVTGRIVAMGEPDERIRLEAADENTKWDGIHIHNSLVNNIFSYVDIADAESLNGSIGAFFSVLTIDNMTFAGSRRRYVRVVNASAVIRNSIFPDRFGPDEIPGDGDDNTVEMINGTGIMAGGQMIIEGNTFGTNKGHNDIIDFSGPLRPAPILQVLNNVFLGASDEVLDLGGDAYIEGNVFMHARRDEFNTSSGHTNVISTGDGPANATIVLVRNVFYDIEHVINLKNNDTAVLEHNTIVGIPPDGADPGNGTFQEYSLVNLVIVNRNSPGRGAHLDGNIIVDVPERIFGEPDTARDGSPGPLSDLVVSNTLLPAERCGDEIGQRLGTIVDLGTNILCGDPMLADVAGGDFSLLPR